MKKVAFAFSIAVLGAVTAIAGTISVPQFNDGGAGTDSAFFPPSLSATFIALKNNTPVPQTYTILYYGLDGTDWTPTANTFTINGNSSVGWRPVNSTDPNQGPDGLLIPSAAPGAPGAGSATILYTDSVDPSGRVFVNAAARSSSYAFALFPAQ